MHVWRSLCTDVSSWSSLQYTIAMMGYGPEDTNTVLELTYNYGVTEYEKGNAYGQVDSLHFPSIILTRLCLT